MAEAQWTDEPLGSTNQDTLDRALYAKRAAERIHVSHSFESSSVFGLSGPWGSGKTSFINMTVEELKQAHPQWVVARFTPWATSDVAGLLGEFYSSLIAALPKKKTRHVKRALAATARVAAPATTAIPYGGGSVSRLLTSISGALTQSPSWEKAFRKAETELKKFQLPILLVVDDIDRLHVDELMVLLRVVRLLGRFDGVQYLLAYDDETLFRNLSTAQAAGENDGSAERFMEKIVQYPLLVPPLLRHQQLTRLNAGLGRVARGDLDEDGRIGALIDSFLSLLQTPRSIDRYIAQLEHHLPLMPPDEIDDVDVILLTLIRMSFPRLFSEIPPNRNELIAGHTGEMDLKSRPFEYVRFDPDPLFGLVPDRHRAHAKKLLVSLFPNLREKGQIGVNGSRTRRGVGTEEYFDRYFAMGIPAHDVSDAEVYAAVDAAAGGDGEGLTALLVSVEDARRLLIVGKAAEPRRQPSTDSGRLKLVEVLTKIVNEMPDEGGTPFGSQDQILSWIGRLLIEVDRNAPPTKILDALADFSSSALRIRAWRRVGYELENRSRETVPGWHEAVNQTLADEAVNGFLHHLELGDEAPDQSSVGYQLHFAMGAGRIDELKREIGTLMDTGRIDRSTLASRLVTARTYTGMKPDWTLSEDFDQETFDRLAPPGHDPWYDEPVVEVDARDLTWTNRRRFVTGRVNAPPVESTS
ncbi:KAP family NTPase [Aeromicrobium sp. CF3.5]|uniref:KAP family NTPase n=1 Tax=Aeromicrobium sp. CF3.5 TaxID=3373078 RepID=UPI003EE77123